MRIVVILVHGTYGWSALFLKPDSALRSALLQRFKEVEFVHFNWSGLNSAIMRHFAAKALRTLLNEIRARDADCRIFLIAHSHGGNIGLRALNAALNGICKIECRLRLAFVICPRISIQKGRTHTTSGDLSTRGDRESLLAEPKYPQSLPSYSKLRPLVT